ncbi:porin family protein [Bacteroides acidifaciens]|uniref:Porin family protein n=4 Tax=Bacteroides acidifaciens TaxID=85831 RepID=A0A4S2ALT3_9BACE|nr:porin family protein [Bacteroides acidifaciens]TGY02096.1 porin family protein [Bacteroides acidifaciens]
MKKVLLFFVLVAMSVVSVNAQDNLKWGVMAGMNVSKYTITGFDSRIGFHAGVKAELGLSQEASGAYMDFAALLTLKGAKIDGGSIASIKFNPYYLEVPVHVGYKYAVNDDFALFGNVGPYIAVGLFGKAKAKVDGNIADLGELGTNSASEDIFGDDGLKRFDFGLGLKAGVEFSKKYQLAISYDFGLVEVAKDLGMKNRNLMISLGYMF